MPGLFIKNIYVDAIMNEEKDELRNQDNLIEGKMIKEIGLNLTVPEGAAVINGNGKGASS
jgi:dihydroorotase-like cyclic amidohydrolase